jgi:hypothetical protein
MELSSDSQSEINSLKETHQDSGDVIEVDAVASVTASKRANNKKSPKKVGIMIFEKEE